MKKQDTIDTVLQVVRVYESDIKHNTQKKILDIINEMNVKGYLPSCVFHANDTFKFRFVSSYRADLIPLYSPMFASADYLDFPQILNRIAVSWFGTVMQTLKNVGDSSKHLRKIVVLPPDRPRKWNSKKYIDDLIINTDVDEVLEFKNVKGSIKQHLADIWEEWLANVDVFDKKNAIKATLLFVYLDDGAYSLSEFPPLKLSEYTDGSYV